MTPQQKYREANRDKVRQAGQDYYQRNKVSLKAKAKLHRERRRGSDPSRNIYYKNRYSITLDDYKILAEKQNYLCAICNLPESITTRSGTTSPLCVDHCHITGRVRGLLCRTCNSALGKFKDSPDIIRSAMEYLTND